MEERNIKKVQIYPSIENLHTSYHSLLSNPPQGYIFIGAEESLQRKTFKKLRSSQFLRNAYHFFLNLFQTTKILEMMHANPELQEADLVFATTYLYKGGKPWILNIIDSPYSLAGHRYDVFLKNKKYIENLLEQKNCKRIICENESCRKLMKRYFSSRVLEKTKVVRAAIVNTLFKNERMYKKNQPITLLFIGSINNPQDFYQKGGLQAIEVFEHLQVKNKTRLIIRCKIPEELRIRVKRNPNIILLENLLSSEEITNLYITSDILLFPSHQYVLMVFLESMYFGLPIVTLDTYATKDFIKDNVNGYIVKKSNKIRAYKELSYPLSLRQSRFFDEVKNIDVECINHIIKKVEFLIENPKIRKKMVVANMRIARENFSIKERNKKLKKIFDDALK